MTANTDDDNIEIIGGDDSLVVDDADGKSLTDLVEQPAKVMRIGTMIKQLLEEVREPHPSDARALRVHVAMLIATPEDAFDENATERQKSRMAE